MEDLKLLADLSEDEINGLSDSLQSIDFADPDSIQSITKRSEIASVERIGAIIYHLAMLVRKSTSSKEEAVEEFREGLEAKVKWGDDQKNRALYAFQKLCIEPVSFDLQHKAQFLSGLTGQKLLHLFIASDIRPVFDEDVHVIKGAFPVHFLHVEFQSGELQKIDIRLSGEQLLELKTVVDRAIEKNTCMLDAIRKIEGWKLPQLQEE